MKITFYTNNSDSKVVDKDITEIGSIEGKLTSSISVRNIQIMINGDIPLDANYVFIPELNRYYYIDNVDIQYNRMPIITLACDVLMTFKDEILHSIGHFSVNTNYNPYSATYDVENRKLVSTMDFNGFAFPAYPTMVLVTSKANHSSWYHGSLS